MVVDVVCCLHSYHTEGVNTPSTSIYKTLNILVTAIVSVNSRDVMSTVSTDSFQW